MAGVMARALLAVAAVTCALGGCGAGKRGGEAEDGPKLGPPHALVHGYADNAVARGLLTPGRYAALAARGEAQVVRLTVDWRAVEPARGQFAFAGYDAVYRAFARRGIRPLWVLGFAPPWARDRVPCPADCRAPPARAAEGDWADFVRRVALRYPRSAGIELWNEPNFANFFYPRVDVPRYVRLQRIGYRAAKRARPRLPVVNGGLANFLEPAAGQVPIDDFLRQVYRHGGRRSMDAISIHPYPGDPRSPAVARSVKRVLDVRDAERDRRRPLWVTETGASTTGPDPALRWSPEAQARQLTGDYDLLSRVPSVRMVLVNTLLDNGNDPAQTESGFGVVRIGGSPKPAFARLRRAFAAKP